MIYFVKEKSYPGLPGPIYVKKVTTLLNLKVGYYTFVPLFSAELF